MQHQRQMPAPSCGGDGIATMENAETTSGLEMGPWEGDAEEGCSHPHPGSSSPCHEETHSDVPVYFWSAPTSPLRTRGLRKARLADVLQSHDVMQLAKNVLAERQSISACEARFEKRTAKPWGRSSVTKTTPASLVAATKGAVMLQPDGWRTVWSADDCNQMRAADEQVAAQQARLLKEEQQKFITEVSATMTPEQQGWTSRSCSPCGRGASSNGTDERRASSPASQRQQRVLASAQRIWDEKMVAMTSKLACKHTQAEIRTAETSRLREMRVAHKQQDQQAAMAGARQRHATIDMYRTRAFMYDWQLKERRRTQGTLSKEAGTGVRQQERAAMRQQLQDKVQQRQQELNERLQQHKLLKLQALETAATAAAATNTSLNNTKAERIAAEREARFQRAASHAARMQLARSAMSQHVLQDMQRIDAMNAQRAQCAQKHEVQVQHQQLSEMVARHYAREFEYQAKVQNKLPKVDAATRQTLARFNLHVTQ